MKRFLACFFAVIILISSAPFASAASDTSFLSRGAAADMLLNAADDYNPGVKRSDIIKGNENGDLEENRTVTRVEAFVMLARAFGKLPTPMGDNLRSGYSASNFKDIPDWAKSELKNLFNSGIIAGTSSTTFSPDDYITVNQMVLLIKRVYALEGTNLKDDFYAAVNKTALDKSVIYQGNMSAGSSTDVGMRVNTQVARIIVDITNGNSRTKNEKNIATLFNNVLSKTARNAAGITPIKTYLDAIDDAKTLQDMMAVNQRLVNEIGDNLLLRFSLGIDAKDSSKYSLTFSTFSPLLGQSGYSDATAEQKSAYMQYISKILTLGGATTAEAATETQLLWDIETSVAAASLPIQDKGDVDKTYNVYKMADLEAMFRNVDLDTIFSLSGMTQTDYIIVSDVGKTKAVAALFDEDHLNTLKVLMRVYLLDGYGECLNDDFKKASDEFDKAYLGVSGAISDINYAFQVVISMMPDYLGQAYVSRYFPAAAKADVKNMVSEIIGVYKKRIQALTWMSDTTKTEAIKKLDTMIIKIGYPDKWDTDLDGVTLKSVAEGGSYFNNVVAISKADLAQKPILQKQKVDKTDWNFSTYTVNACYNPYSNSIEFPAAILQAPFYDLNASREENLGGIGYIISHEITHAFDNNGAKFDENGNATDWWTDGDYEAFEKLCVEVASFYDGCEAAPGIACSGILTLSENIADLGAVSCVTQVAGMLQNPDYKKLYTSMAKAWCSSYSRETRLWLSKVDVHAPDKLRGGLTLAMQEQFYKAFGIQAGDGMYIAPENRISIW